MRQNSIEVPAGIRYLVGDCEVLNGMDALPAKRPFAPDVLDFLNDVSRTLMADQRSRTYSDVVTFAFWIRKSSTSRLKERFGKDGGNVRLGRGAAFHIAPSNVPVNYAYSLAAGLLTGNANVVRIPSRAFPQTEIINGAISRVLAADRYRTVRDSVCLVRYGREREINDYLSWLADVRIIWGGNETIAELRKSPLRPRAGEVAFADRFSLAVIDSDAYLAIPDKDRTAEDFYNDTYFTDQNACTSPRLVVWMGERKERAKEIFWAALHELVKQKYTLQPIQSVNKLTNACMLAAAREGVRVEPRRDNRIVRVRVPELTGGLMDLKDNSGYFFEYDCEDILELRELCNDEHCQTVSYIGCGEMLDPLLAMGVKGIDRIVPVGKTMDFDLIWDGCNLYERLTRVVSITG